MVLVNYKIAFYGFHGHRYGLVGLQTSPNHRFFGFKNASETRNCGQYVSKRLLNNV